MQLLLDAGATVCVNTADSDGETPLVRTRYHHALRILWCSLYSMMGICHMARWQLANRLWFTPHVCSTYQHTAARGWHAEVVALLLENGADPSVTNNAGRLPEEEARGACTCPSPYPWASTLLLMHYAFGWDASFRQYLPMHGSTVRERSQPF